MINVSRLTDNLLARTGARANVIPRLRTRLSGGVPLAYHGIQRSGTNYCLKSLRVLGCLPLNMFDGRRNAPTHKHFRWQADKSSITLEPRFANLVQISSVDDLNQAADYPADTVHLVMQKEIGEWAVSIVNWGIFCHWWPDVETALANQRSIFEEYHHYHSIWHDLKADAPQRIEILDLQSVLTGAGQPLISALDRLGVEINSITRSSFDGHFNEVPMSTPRRRDHLDDGQKQDLRDFIRAEALRRQTPTVPKGEDRK